MQDDSSGRWSRYGQQRAPSDALRLRLVQHTQSELPRRMWREARGHGEAWQYLQAMPALRPCLRPAYPLNPWSLLAACLADMTGTAGQTMWVVASVLLLPPLPAATMSLCRQPPSCWMRFCSTEVAGPAQNTTLQQTTPPEGVGHGAGGRGSMCKPEVQLGRWAASPSSAQATAGVCCSGDRQSCPSSPSVCPSSPASNKSLY